MDKCSFKDEQQKETQRPIKVKEAKDPKAKRAKEPRGPKGQTTPRAPPARTHCNVAALDLLLSGKDQATNTKQRGEDGTGHRAPFKANFLKEHQRQNWSSFEAIKSTMRFNLILNAVCDFKDDELKCST